MEGYTKNKMYLTVMYMWDEKMDFILSATYDPLRLGRGEAGLARIDNNEEVSMSGLSSLCSKTSRRSSPYKGTRMVAKKDPQDTMATMVKSIIDVVMTKDDDTISKSGKRKKSKNKSTKESNMSLKDQSLQDLMTLVEKHQNYLKFLDGCNMLTAERKQTIVAEIENVWTIISNRSNKRTRDFESSSCNSSVS